MRDERGDVAAATAPSGGQLDAPRVPQGYVRSSTGVHLRSRTPNSIWLNSSGKTAAEGSRLPAVPVLGLPS